MPEIEISAMTFGPFGVGRLDGKAVMVAGAVAGDRLNVEIVSERRDYALARIREILRASAERRVAPCPYLPRCGGCDWQHIDYGAQVRFKGEVVARELGHALGVAIDPAGLVEPAPAEFGYRSRIRLRVGAKGVLGFYSAGSNTIVEIDSCMVAEPGIRMPLHLARSLGKRVEEIEVVRDGAREVQVAHLKKPAAEEELRRASNVLESDREIAGIVLRSGTHRATAGDSAIAIELEAGLSIEVDADLFSQVNRAQNRKLVARVMEMAAIHESAAVLDLFCGAGNFSLPASRRGARVTGVDADARSNRGGGAQRGAVEISRRTVRRDEGVGDRRFSASRALSSRGHNSRSAAHRRARSDGTDRQAARTVRHLRIVRRDHAGA